MSTADPKTQPEVEPVADKDTDGKASKLSPQQQKLFPKVFPNVRMLVFPFRFLGYWLGRKLWAEDPHAPQARTLLEDIVYGEGPRFRIPTGELYFTDMHDKKVVKYSLASGKRTLVYDDPEDMLSGLGWLPGGRLLISSMNKRQVLVHDEKSGATELYADVKDVTQVRANDMVVATSGRAYLGSFGFHHADLMSIASSAIVSVGTDGAVRVEATGVVFPNGMVITPDGKTLIAGETFEGRLTAYDIDEDGKLSKGRLWADVGSLVDGICLDAEGCVWTSIVQSGLYQTGGGLVRVKEGGEVMEVLGFGANGIKNGVFACQLGTDAGGKHQLFFMEAATSYDHLIWKDGPEAARKNGLVRTIEVKVGPARISGNDAYCGGYC
jgi:sugar lactone lactonase YvrE